MNELSKRKTPREKERQGETVEPKRLKKSKNSILLKTALLSFLFFIVCSICVFSYFVFFPQKSESQKIFEEVSSKALLPKESPTLFKMSDAHKIKEESPFFAAAEDGDVLLVFTESRLVILYRPLDKKIVRMSPLGSQQEVVQESHTSNSEKTISTSTFFEKKQN